MTKEARKVYDNKYRKNPRYYVDRKIRDYFRWVIKKGGKESKYESLLGYSIEEFRNRIRALFLDGMSFENFGEWHIDHIQGRINYTYESFTCPELRACYSLDNLRPLWAVDNLKRKKK